MAWERRKLCCSGCGRHRSKRFLGVIEGKFGLYCAVCQRGPKPEKKKK